LTVAIGSKLVEIAIDLIRNFAWYASVIIILHFAERRWPAGEAPTFRDQAFNFFLALSGALSLTAVSTIAPFAMTFVRACGLEKLVLREWTPHNAPEWIAGALFFAFAWDLFQYWFHRLTHSFQALWFTHALHHDSAVLNSTDAIRHTIWYGLLQGIFVGVPLLIIGAYNVLHLYAGILLFSTWGFYNHANIRLGHGRMTPVVSGPQFHRIHHGVDPMYHNKNFAAFFPVIDIIFGTYQSPAPGEFPLTGLPNRAQARGGARRIVSALLGY